MVNGPGTVILIGPSVWARRNWTSRTSTVARIVEIDAVEGGGESVAVAFAADLAVGNDVEAGALHVADGDPRSVVLGLFEERLRNAPQVSGAYARRQPPQQLVEIDEP